ncbi:hypothetical protein [Actinoplanes sp. G11-F43]|uniref:hypothetical protein n=1 Tax=Actinoplanes sp. G11-F43 TaxID=3424130 RepID=UPI003D33372E
MGHNITALIVAEPFDEAVAREWGVTGEPLGHGIRLVHLNAAYTTYQQHQRRAGTALEAPEDFPPVFPREGVIADLAAALTARRPPAFALIMTDYFGGTGSQWATAWSDGHRHPEVRDVNSALRALGVQRTRGRDEFDTVGLADHRRTPEALEEYWDLCEKLGI